MSATSPTEPAPQRETRSLSGPLRRATSTSLAPLRASVSASAAPIPALEPAITITLSFIGTAIIHMGGRVARVLTCASASVDRPQVFVEPVQHFLDRRLLVGRDVAALEDRMLLVGGRRAEHLEHRHLRGRVRQIEVLAAVDHEHRLRHVRRVVDRIDFGRNLPRLEAARHQDAGLEPRLDREEQGSELRAEARSRRTRCFDASMSLRDSR